MYAELLLVALLGLPGPELSHVVQLPAATRLTVDPPVPVPPAAGAGSRSHEIRFTGDVNAAFSSTQAPTRRSRKVRVVSGAIVGAAVVAVLASTVGQEACLGGPRWHCAAGGAAYGAAIGALAAR
jgi:hypothetical protein